MAVLLLFAGLSAQAEVPRRQIPPSVLAEVSRLENRFELALYADCAAERCFAKGCTYVDHAVIDQPRSSSLPGFGLDPGPGSVETQEFLTQATCAYAHEAAEEASDIQTLNRRLSARLSSGWLVVSIDNQALQPLPEYFREDPDSVEEEVEEAEASVEPPEPTEWWSSDVAGRELWTALLPHFFWMVGLLLATVFGSIMLWSWRRVGTASIEEQALLAQLTQPGGGGTGGAGEPDGAVVVESDEPDDFAAEQARIWHARLQAMDPAQPDPELQALIRELLRARELPLLAQAVLRFPDHFPPAFPSGGDLAAAKLQLADYLKTVDTATLPEDGVFFESLNRHALAASLLAQSDAQLVRSLREDFGAAGLVEFTADLPPRIGALLFALAPPQTQHEMVRLLTDDAATEMAGELLRSNRMDDDEADYLFAVLSDRGGVPEALQAVRDRGAAFDAAAALSVLLPRVPAARRAGLFDAALSRFSGSLPAWYRGILLPDMLLALSSESRADLMLGVDSESLAAWMSVQDTEDRAALLSGLPESLRLSVAASSAFASRARQLSLAERGRQDLARGLQQQLVRANLSFEQIVTPSPGAP